jgi:hypothetical protein
MDRLATHLIPLLIAAAIVAVAAPIAQGGNRNHRASAQMPDSVLAAYTAAWQAYRGLPGGPPARTVPDVRRAYTAAWQAYRGLPGGPPASTRSGYPQPATGLAAAQGFRYAAPIDRARATPPTANSSGGFDWSDWAIGIGTGLGLALILGAGLLIGRQLRHRGIQTA